MNFYRDLATDSILNRKNLDTLHADLELYGLQELADDMLALRLGLHISGERLFRLSSYLLICESRKD